MAAYGLERPTKETAEVFVALGKEKIIPENFVDTMIRMTGYRNVLVHGYLEVDRHQTYINLQKHLPDISKFIKYIEEFIQRRGKK